MIPAIVEKKINAVRALLKEFHSAEGILLFSSKIIIKYPASNHKDDHTKKINGYGGEKIYFYHRSLPRLRSQSLGEDGESLKGT